MALDKAIEQMSKRELTRPFNVFAVFGLLMIGYFSTRLVNLLNTPLFWDEASYIWIAQLIRRDGDWLMPLHPPMGGWDLAPLFMWIIAVFLPVSSDPALVGRALSVVVGALGLVGTYFVASKIYGSRVGVMASVLYVVSPFELFYHRKAICEPLLATCGIWTLFFTFDLMKGSRKTRSWVGLSGSMLLAILTKVSGYVIVVLPAVTFLFFFRSTAGKRRLAVAYFTFVCALLSLNVLGISFSSQFQTWKSAPIPWVPSEVILSELIELAAKSYVDIFVAYLTPLLAGFALLSVLYAILRGTKSEGLLLLWFLFPLFAIPSSCMFARRVFFVIVPLLILLSHHILLGIDFARSRLSSFSVLGQKARVLAFVLAAILLFNSVVFDCAILTDPTNAPLPKVDRWEHITGASSGYGISDAIIFLQERASTGPITVIVPWYPTYSVYLDSYPNIRLIQWFRNDSIEKYFPGSGDTYVLFDIGDDRHPYFKIGLEQSENDTMTRFLNANPKARLVAEFPKPDHHNIVQIYYIDNQ